mmetsp:Transcript_24750/g.57688  ORF Transcript_24750/g.57688 Transcript_24750/m.57688 type:complete len:337 (-) Transcript_24750:1341-2351(-)|eukprot:CAMPEP_0116849344 /NCGR_PEP_ID=MMETSP0418-20121206/15519_1 /TAXON_ID=1158023 /ORGANISM="Astrosyne radiata, Strain 13vi08-1A" /LENGTH=336 /DNA_ID=CAMNT_0004481053 /DNA_START=35 /DNA_END=1045 /DNA_ORIENTATION=-
MSTNPLSAEEAEKAQAEVKQAVVDIGDDDDLEGVDGNFKVSKEELTILRANLASEFPEDFLYLSDAYILSVASKPYSKDTSIRRPLEYSQEKLNQVMQWRAESGATEMEDLVKLANGPPTATEAVEDPERYAKAKALVTSLNTGSIYFHGFTKEGRPVMWVRTSRKSWYPDVVAEVHGLILLADAGIRCMPDGITDFVCACETSYPPPPNPTFLVSMLKALVRGYPDRLHFIFSAPISSIVQFVVNLLLPLMPGRLASKVALYDAAKGKEKLTEMLLHGEDDIPTFMGGTCDHDELYPEESKCPNRGEGMLKFDYFGMVERLQKSKEEFEASKKTE